MKIKTVSFIFPLILLVCFYSIHAQEIEVPLTFRYGAGGTTPPGFPGVNHAIGMDQAAAHGLDMFDENELLPPIGPISANVASFIIGSLRSAKDFRPLSNSASWILELIFSDLSETIILEWDPSIFKAGGDVFKVSKANLVIGNSSDVGFSVAEVRNIADGSILFNLINPDDSDTQITVVDTNTVQYAFVPDGSKIRAVQLVLLAFDNAPPVAINDPVNIFISSPSSFFIDVLANDFDPDPGETISIIDGSFPSTITSSTASRSDSVELGMLSSNGSQFQFTPASNLDFTSIENYEGEFQYQVQDNNQSQSIPATVTVKIFNRDVVIHRSLGSSTIISGEGEDIWLDVTAAGSTNNIYDEGIDIKVFDGASSIGSLPNWLTYNGVVGNSNNLFFKDIHNDGYTSGDDIWLDSPGHLVGIYDEFDLQVYDGNDGWNTSIGTIGDSGLVYYDADDNGTYTTSANGGNVGVEVTLDIEINTNVINDLTKLNIKETLPASDYLMGFWYIPAEGFNANGASLDVTATAKGVRPDLQSLHSQAITPDLINGNGSSRTVTFGWSQNQIANTSTFSIVYRIVGLATEHLEKTVSSANPTGFVNSTVTYDPDNVSDNGNELSFNIENTGFTPTKNVVNINAPTIENVAFSLAEDSPINTQIGNLSGTDLEGDNVSYQITSGNSLNLFNIDENTGELTLTGAVDHENLDEITLDIQLKDNGSPPRINNVNVTISITDNNEAPSVNAHSFMLDENSSLGKVIGTVEGVDEDYGDSLSYSLTGSVFTIDSTGTIRIAQPEILDFETSSQFNLTVRVEDRGGLFQENNVTVNLNDVFEISFDKGWNLFSFPVSPNYTLAEFCTIADVDNVWEWGDNQFKIARQLKSSVGYWIYGKKTGGTNLSVPGNLVGSDTMNLKDGWNLIGPSMLPPFSGSSVEITSISNPSISVSTKAWTWDGERFIKTKSLASGASYWIYSPAPVVVNVGGFPVNIAISYNDGSSEINVSLTPAEFADHGWQDTHLSSAVETINITSAGSLYINDDSAVINLIAEGSIGFHITGETNVNVSIISFTSKSGNVSISSGRALKMESLAISAANGAITIDNGDVITGGGINNINSDTNRILGGTLIFID